MRILSRRTALLHAGSAALLSGSGARAYAQGASDWPNKPVRIIVNYGPGGGSDNMTRPFA